MDEHENRHEQDEKEPRAVKQSSPFDTRTILLWCVVVLAAIALALMISVVNSLEQKPVMRSGFSEEASEHSTESSVPEVALSEEPAYSVPEEEQPFLHGWVINGMGYTYLYGDLGLEQFNYSERTFDRFLNSVSGLSSLAPDGTSVFCMPVPTQVGFLYASIPDEIKKQDNFFNSSQSAFLDTLEERLPKRVTPVLLFDPFRTALEDGEELFFRTDRNWTAKAAFLAYRQFCKASGNPATSTDVYTEQFYDGFLGSFYKATGAAILSECPERFCYYHNEDTDHCKVTLYEGNTVFKNYRLTGNGFSEASDAYLSYLGTEGAHFKIESPCLTEQKLLIIGDESAAAMLPFLIENYSEIHYLCPSRFRGSLQDIFSENKFKDILIVSYLTNAVKGDFPVFLETIAGVQNG